MTALSIIHMNHSPKNRQNQRVYSRRLTPREELVVEIRAAEMTLKSIEQVKTEFPEFYERTQKELTELREQLRKMDEQDKQDDQQSA